MVKIQIGNNFSKIITRIPLPIQLTTIHTIHNAQGFTLDCSTFDPKGVTKHGLTIYIAKKSICSKKLNYI
jgi:hypothetical protein